MLASKLRVKCSGVELRDRGSQGLWLDACRKHAAPRCGCAGTSLVEQRLLLSQGGAALYSRSQAASIRWKATQSGD